MQRSPPQPLEYSRAGWIAAVLWLIQPLLDIIENSVRGTVSAAGGEARVQDLCNAWYRAEDLSKSWRPACGRPPRDYEAVIFGPRSIHLCPHP